MLLETLVKYSSLFFHKIDKTDIRLFLESSPQYPNLLSVVQTLRYLDTDVFGVEISDLVASEALTTDYLHVFASPKFEWAYKKLELTLNLPVNLYSYFFSGTIHNRTEFFLSPSLFMLNTKLTFNVSRRIEISVSATNLFNKKEYGYTSYSTVSQYERSSKLRGREFMISIYLKK